MQERGLMTRRIMALTRRVSMLLFIAACLQARKQPESPHHLSLLRARDDPGWGDLHLHRVRVQGAGL